MMLAARTLSWIACGLLLSTSVLSHTPGTVISAPARVIDGDTVEVAGYRVRLNGVAAPEAADPGGPAATAELVRIIGGRMVRCILDGSRTLGREVGICRVGNLDIGAAVIAAGWARDCRRFSRGRYAEIEPASARRLPLPDYCR